MTDSLDEFIFKALDNMIKIKDFDLFSGYIGVGLYFIEKSTSRYAKPALQKIVEAISEHAIEDDNGFFFYDYSFPEEDKNYSVNLGLAHGMPSLVIFLSKIKKLGYFETTVSRLIEKSIGWILTHKLKNRASLFSDKISSSDLIDSRLAWCYGDLDIALMLYHAGIALENKDWIDEGKAIAIHSSYRRNINELFLKDSCLCHGFSGVYYLFTKLHENLKGEQLNDAKQFWFKEIFKRSVSEELAGLKTFYQTEEPSLDHSLLEGLAGIGLILLSSLPGANNDWDKFFLIS